MSEQFFYDENIRKWLYQIIRYFSEFTVQYGLNSDGSQAYSTVPVVWADSTFSAATIARLNSENVMPNFPMISLWISDLKYNRQNIYTPTFEDTKSVRTRQWDANVGAFLPQQGNAYTVKRFMPVPYLMTVKLDLVTSNTNQKCQILEQILPLYNPSLDIQKVDNYIDWESLTTIELKDVTWSNRTIPVNQSSDSSYDVCTLTFELPIWMSLPARVSKMGVIFKVITSLNELNSNTMTDMVLGTRQVVTYNNYGLFVSPNNTIQALQQATTTNVHLPNDIPFSFWNSVNTNTSNALLHGNTMVTSSPYFVGPPIDWNGLIGVYGQINPGVSMIGLSYDDSPNEILGTITVSPIDPTVMLFTPNVSTLPSNTLSSINGVVNPLQVAPGSGLPNAAIGQSYIITSNIGSAWPYDTSNANASANINDIITYNGTEWTITFDAAENSGNVEFVFDNSKDLQYQWNGNAWVQGWYGPYDASSWRMIL